MSRLAPLLLAGVLLGACQAGTAGSAAHVPSTSPSSSTGSPHSPLSFCDPNAAIDLRDPVGERVDISGPWTQAQAPYPSDIVTIAARQQGDCVWIIETVAFGDAPGVLVYGRQFQGRLGSDFRIVGEFAKVWGGYPGDPWTYGPFVFRIEFDGNAPELTEDRDPTVPPPGCTGSPGSCPSPLHYVRPT